MPAKTIVVRLAAFAGIALIAACAPEIEGRLYLQDIQEVADTGTPTIVPVQLRIPESSEDECKKGLADLALKLHPITPITDEGECVEVNNNQFSQFTMDLPIVPPGATLDVGYLMQLTVTSIDGATGPGIALNLGMSRTLADVQDAIGRGADSGFSVSSDQEEQPKFIFTIENDLRAPAGLMPNFVFVDGKPGLPDLEQAVSLDRRQSAKIQFSDVVAAHIADAKNFTFATLYLGGA